MADKDKLKPGTDILEKGSARLASDRAKRISSLHRSVDDLVQEQNKKRLQVSNEVSALTREQQKLMQELEFERSQITGETATAYSGVIKGLGNTIKQLSLGIKNITKDTASASAQAISQYGKAISEDISINKTNTIAMALSRATPLFGYFAAKFVETDVFQDAARRIKDRIGGAVSEGLSKAGHSVAGIFRKGKEAEQYSMREDFGAVTSEVSDLRKQWEKEPPRLQAGGYVKQGGMVQVHAAEVVTPIDKLLAQIDESKSREVAKRLGANLQLMAQTMDRLETVVVEREVSQKTVIQTFIDEWKRARNPRIEDWQTRVLKALTELKVSMVGTTSQLRIAWQRTLIQHPTFRAMLMFGQTLQSVFTAPWKMLFGARGGYGSDVRRATSTSNTFMKMVNLLSILYTKGMPKLDTIALYTKASAEAAVGREIRPTTPITYTWFDKIRERMTSRGIGDWKTKSFDAFVDHLGLDKGSLKDAGITSLTDLFSPGTILRNMGFTFSNVSDMTGGRLGRARAKGAEFGARAKFAAGEAGDYVQDATGKAKSKVSQMVDYLKTLVKLKSDQEKREGPHSPSMAENIAKTARATITSVKERVKTEKAKLNLLERIKRKTAESSDHLKGMGNKLKKWGKKIWGWIPIIFQTIMSFLRKGLGKGLGMANIGMHAAGSAIGTGVSYGVGKLGAAAGALKLGKAAKFAGKVGLRAGGLFAGAGMAGWDMVSAMINPEGFVKSRMISGFAAFLGGKDEGLAGAKRGVMKGGLIGFGIGGPIGGAIGALAGGILGFIGGKNLAQVLQTEVKAIGEIVGAIWKIIKYPFQVIKEGFKSVWVLTKYLYKRIDAWLSGPGFIGYIWGKIKDFFGWIRDKIVYAIDWWKKFINVKRIQEILMKFMHPISGLVMLVKFVGEWIDKTVSNIPIIGRIYKAAKSAATKISAGTLASDLEASLNSTLPKAVTAPAKYNSSTIPEEMMPKASDYLAAIAEKHAKRKATEYLADKKLTEKQTKELEKAMGESGKKNVQAIISSSNSIVNSNTTNSNVSSRGGGGSPGSVQFSSGNKHAENVVRNFLG